MISLQTIMLVSLAQASAHLKRDTSDDDADLELKIKGASRAVVNYVGSATLADSSGEIPVDSSGVALFVPEDIESATLLFIGELYKNRGGDQDGRVSVIHDYGYGYLPYPVTAMLYHYRTPTVA